jgi:Glucose-6-phosphate dehydrogenase, NAD binding domain
MPPEKLSALVIFGATGDLAKLETFPALVGLVDRDVLDVPIVGVAKSGWGLDQFRGYAADSLRHNGIDPDADPAKRMLDMLQYVDGDLTDDATYETLAKKVPAGPALFYLEVPPPLFRPNAALRPAHRRRAGRQPAPVRAAGRRGGGVARRRPDPRRCRAGAPLRPGHVGTGRGRPAPARGGDLA